MSITRLLGIEHPIIQAPMAGVQGSALAVAVSNAGGLGSLPCAMLGPEALRAELEALRAGTGKPFNVARRAAAVLPRTRRRSAKRRRRPGPPALRRCDGRAAR
jgi:NAD(P)H-dependent flavin oxidoreductase YrpB (nitropropane dioxygenase family)